MRSDLALEIGLSACILKAAIYTPERKCRATLAGCKSYGNTHLGQGCCFKMSEILAISDHMNLCKYMQAKGSPQNLRRRGGRKPLFPPPISRRSVPCPHLPPLLLLLEAHKPKASFVSCFAHALVWLATNFPFSPQEPFLKITREERRQEHFEGKKKKRTGCHPDLNECIE